ncbi:MAG: cold shock domain-containing protein [Bacteroidales bacterium]|nr:cold shock domain-containing protein [Bacteroidales bacterium]
MKTGKVKFYNTTKGFGFITAKDGEDIFFHRSGLSNSFQDLESGQDVEFETRTGDKGLMAVNVMLSF